MIKEKLGIVSSYDTLCGNASYTKALVEELSKYFEVTVVSLNAELLRKSPKARNKEYIKNFRLRLQAFDVVNIQFEAGLFGSNPRSVLHHFFPIAKACKRLVLTMHRFHDKEPYPGFKGVIKRLLQGKLKTPFRQLQNAYSNNMYLPVYYKIISFCKKNDVPIIVHTQRECELIKLKCRYDQAHHHPLCFFQQSYYESLKKACSRTELCKRLSLNETNVYVSIFGFINSYKGHETIIKALEYLPENYHLLIFGSQHPLSIRFLEPIEFYIGELLKLIEKKGLTHRVKFFGTLNDEDFLKALICFDFNVLPYLEVNQGGSAIAALSLESGSKAIFSQNLAFLELSKYAPNSFKTFSIGNYIELAHAILSYSQADYKENLKTYHNSYNTTTNTELYRNLLAKQIGAK